MASLNAEMQALTSNERDQCSGIVQHAPLTRIYVHLPAMSKLRSYFPNTSARHDVAAERTKGEVIPH